MLDQINEVLAELVRDRVKIPFRPTAFRFETERGRLVFVRDGGAFGARRKAVSLQNGGRWPTFDYGQFGLGGTQAQCVAQLYRWWKGKPRSPLDWWRRGLDEGSGGPVTAKLMEHGYAKGAITGCIFCGSATPWDWWSLGEDEGPCCMFGSCRLERKGSSDAHGT